MGTRRRLLIRAFGLLAGHHGYPVAWQAAGAAMVLACGCTLLGARASGP